MHHDLHGARELQQPAPFPDFVDQDACFRARSLVRSERPAHNRAVVGSNPSGPMVILAPIGK